jgi:hypothetical protein
LLLDFLSVAVGDVVAVASPRQPPYLAQVICCEGGARSGHPSFLQVVREDDLAVLTIQADWVLERLPGGRGPEKKPKKLAVKERLCSD